MSETREAILRAAREVLESAPHERLTLGRVAERAGVSRQAVYLHFASRTDLLLELVEWVDEHGRLGRLMARAAALDDPVERLLATCRAAARYATDVADAALALRAAREVDPAARAAWDDRARRRWGAIRSEVAAVADAGRLAPGWSVRRATDAVWALLGFTLYEDLVRDRGWSARRYEDFVVETVRRAVVAET